MTLLADHENLWEINRQVPAITLGMWLIVITFAICRRLLRALPPPWHATRLGILADVTVVVAVATAIVGALPRSESGSKTCGPVLYEWRTSASGCGDTLASLRLATFAGLSILVVLVAAVALLKRQPSMTTERP